MHRFRSGAGAGAACAAALRSSVVLLDCARAPAKNADRRLQALVEGGADGGGGDGGGAEGAEGAEGGGAAPACRASFARVRIPLEDLDLAALCAAVAPGRRAVVCAKHLCGAATDYVLRAAVGARARGAAADAPAALVLGTCCHHRCAWHAYPNRPYLEALGLRGASHFAALCRVATWGVSQPVLGAEGDAAGGAADGRAELGRKAKDLLDEGRAEYLRAHGYDVALQTYVDGAVTPENVLIVATDRSLDVPLGSKSEYKR